MRTEEHATDRPHNAYVAQRFLIRGTLLPFAFLNFTKERAEWLSIDGWATTTNAGEIMVIAAGPEAMVGAFEMALLLGPLDALVREFETFDAEEEVEPGFRLV